MDTLPQVIVLMSTYNGMNYLPDQLSSLEKQKDVNLHLLVRDDCSTDETPEYLEEYCRKHDNIDYYCGPNLKPAQSFLDLIRNSPNADYYAFCDQDDIWDEDKIICAVRAIINDVGDRSTPVLYFGNLRVVDKNLNFIRLSHSKPLRQVNKYSSLVEPLPTGCTIVFNNALMSLLRDRLPAYCSMHDTWVYMVAKFFGTVVYDFEPHISYRQHDNNVIGTYKNKGIKFYYSKIIRMFDRSLQPRFQNAISFYEAYYDLLNTEDKKKILELVHYKDSFFSKLKLLFDRDIYATSLSRDVRNRILIVLGIL